MYKIVVNNFIIISLFTFITTFLIAERTDHDDYNERTSWLLGKIQRMTDAVRLGESA